MMRLQHLMLADAMVRPSTDADFYRRRAEAAQRLKDDATQRDAEALADTLRLVEGRVFPAFDALLVYLTSHERTLLGRSLGLSETHRVRRLAEAAWATTQDSGMAVVQDSEAPALVTCAWGGCGRTYVQRDGWGIFCSTACAMAEMDGDA